MANKEVKEDTRKQADSMKNDKSQRVGSAGQPGAKKPLNSQKHSK